jgi:hypothetical protein
MEEREAKETKLNFNKTQTQKTIEKPKLINWCRGLRSIWESGEWARCFWLMPKHRLSKNPFSAFFHNEA